MALPFDDFFRRMTGQPMALPGATMVGGGPVNAPTPNAATVAQPSLEQLQSQDYQRAAMQRMGQLGMLLMAAGQRLTPAQRATILAQAPQYMDGMQRDMMTAAQARLMNAQQQAAQDELGRTEALRSKLSDPVYLRSIGLTPEQAQALGPAGIQKLLENQAMANTPDALLDRQVKQAQLRAAEKSLNNNPYTETISRNQAEFDARMMQGQQLGLKGDDLTQFAANGKLPDSTKANETQSNTQTFLKMMDEAEGNLAKLPAMAGASRWDRAYDAIPVFGHGFTSPEYQQAEQAQRQFIQAWLRKTSGAAISPAEFEAEGRKFFPQPGDGPEVIAQKAAARKAAREGLLSGTTSAFQRDYKPPETNDMTEINGVKIRRIN